MKRKLASAAVPKAKKPRAEVPAYHLTPSISEDDGSIQWPAPRTQIEDAQGIIKDCAAKQRTTLIVPDKDADGLTSGLILRTTLKLLGLQESLIHVHFLSKGNDVYAAAEREAMAAYSPHFIFVLDQGSRPGARIVSDLNTTVLILDHHFAHYPTDFPPDTAVVSACHSPPVATTSLLTFELCKPLHPSVAPSCSWLCALGTHGDLGNTLKWEPPFPSMTATFAVTSKASITSAIPFLNAPRRTSAFNVSDAWTALLTATSPASLTQTPALLAARAEVAAETERCTHTPPSFSSDGRVAVLRIHSAAQVHPLIATRWASHLSSRVLAFVLVANTGYVEGRVHFSCRVARVARAREGDDVDIIAELKAYAGKHESGTLLVRMGESFARGHVQASGGIVGLEEFEELMAVMEVGRKRPGEGKKTEKAEKGQKNKLTGYFGKK